MARIVLGPNVTDIRGRFGSIVYSIWKTGVQYMRQTANVIANPHSASQTSIRDRITVLSKRWYDNLSAGQRAGWNDWAQTKPGMGNGDGGIMNIIKGNGGIMSGFNAYLLANQWLNTISVAIVDDAPLGLTPPSAPLNVAASYLPGHLTVTWDLPVTIKVGARVRLWIANHQQLIHRQYVNHEAAATLTFDLTQVKGAGGVGIPIENVPGDYIVQMDTVDVDGTKSGPSNAAEVTVA